MLKFNVFKFLHFTTSIIFLKTWLIIKCILAHWCKTLSTWGSRAFLETLTLYSAFLETCALDSASLQWSLLRLHGRRIIDSTYPHVWAVLSFSCHLHFWADLPFSCYPHIWAVFHFSLSDLFHISLIPIPTSNFITIHCHTTSWPCSTPWPIELYFV